MNDMEFSRRGFIGGAAAFFKNEDLESVSIPDGVKVIGEKAFAYCENLKKARIPDYLPAG